MVHFVLRPCATHPFSLLTHEEGEVNYASKVCVKHSTLPVCVSAFETIAAVLRHEKCFELVDPVTRCIDQHNT